MKPYGYGHVDAARVITSAELDAMFMALADPTRRAILTRLASGEASVAELAAPFSMSQPAVSKHLKVLERAGLISVGQDAQRRPRSINPEAIDTVRQWIENWRASWEERYQRLDSLLAEMQCTQETHTPPDTHTPQRHGRKQ